MNVLTDSWLARAAGGASREDATETTLQDELAARCSDKAYRYFMKKFDWMLR